MNKSVFGQPKQKGRWLSIFGVILSLIALALASATYLKNSSSVVTNAGNPKTEIISEQPIPSLLARMDHTGELHAGYGVYPPYTQEDPNTKAVSGFSVAIVEQIAKELNVRIVWHRLNWNTMAADLKRGEYDIIADPIFQTIPRAREFAFTEPYAYFADGIAVVRKKENRFKSFASLDQKGVKIAVGKGWASETLVKTRFTKAEIVTILTSNDLLQVFNEVLAGRADVAVADGGDAKRFMQEHPKEVKALGLDTPPAFMPAGFALRFSDKASADFFSVALRNLRYTGILDALAQRYDIPAMTLRGPQ